MSQQNHVDYIALRWCVQFCPFFCQTYTRTFCERWKPRPRPKLQHRRQLRWTSRTWRHTSRHACGASAPWSSTATCTALSPFLTADSSLPPSSPWKPPAGVCGRACCANPRRTARETSALPATECWELPSLCRPGVCLPFRRVSSSCGVGWSPCGLQCGTPWIRVCRPVRRKGNQGHTVNVDCRRSHCSDVNQSPHSLNFKSL